MSRIDVTAVAKESKIILLQRLHNGGKNMPAPTLSEAEIRSLVAYLEQLSGVPGAERNHLPWSPVKILPPQTSSNETDSVADLQPRFVRAEPAEFRVPVTREELLPVGYFHLVFTIPHEPSWLALQNKKVAYDLWFRPLVE